MHFILRITCFSFQFVHFVIGSFTGYCVSNSLRQSALLNNFFCTVLSAIPTTKRSPIRESCRLPYSQVAASSLKRVINAETVSIGFCVALLKSKRSNMTFLHGLYSALIFAITVAGIFLSSSVICTSYFSF